MPTIFCLIIIICVWIRYESKKSSRLQEDSMETFFKEEKKANIPRKRDISNLDYITIPLQSLPIQKGTDENINDYIDSLLMITQKPIVNLSKYSNTDLKLQFGIANFDILSEYDENYYTLIRLLADYGCYLYEMKDYAKAKHVLEYSISIGSDMKACILTLCKIYSDELDETNLNKLLTYIKESIPDKQEALLSEIEKIKYHPYFCS